MSCVNPGLMVVMPLSKQQQNIGYIDFLKKKKWQVNKDHTKAYRFVKRESRNLPLEDIEDWKQYSMIEVPCGGCVQCRLDYARDWAVRCQFETQLWKDNYFVTLTYDNDHVPIGKTGNMSLDKSHIDKFIKTLRKKFSKLGHTGLRYLLCGEYNSSGERALNPHYHMILFNCPLNDLTIDFPDGNGGLIHRISESTKMPMFYSQLIQDCWQKGFTTVDDANFNTESYVTRYIMKKQKGENAFIYPDSLGVVAPFLRMSNRPGIGFNMFMQDAEKYIENPSVIVPRSNKKPLLTGLPKYYKRKLIDYEPSLRDMFEEQAKYQEGIQRSVRQHYGLTSNQQKAAVQSKADSVASIFTRNYN